MDPDYAMITRAKSTAFMNKLPFLLSLILACTTGTQAQIRLGILGGIHSADIQETNHIQGWDTAVRKYQSSHSGIQIGIIVEMPIGHKGFYFQPAILYTAKGQQYAKYNDSNTFRRTDTVYSKGSLDLGYIDVPLNLTYKIPLSANHKNSFFISAGPYVSFFYSGKKTSEALAKQTDSTRKYTIVTNPVSVGKGSDTYKTFDWGVNARAGFELGKVLLSGYFSQGLTSFYNAPYQGTFHHQLLGFSVGVWLTSSTPPPPLVKDTDKDGIPDDQDLCPLQPGTMAWHGCPVPDTDHDGIDDEHDSCRTVPGVARYNGCPIPDSDHDGINDEEDKCPNQVGLARYQGCPIPDRDGDGVNDEEDKCPDEPGTLENHGCPEIKEDVGEKIHYTAQNIQFTKNSDHLLKSSQAALDGLAGLLEAHPELQLTIEGHTDNVGVPEKNLLLSQKRAGAVKSYLVKIGIPESRLTAIGYGQEKPIADNTTDTGKAANRRVELRMSIDKK